MFFMEAMHEKAWDDLDVSQISQMRQYSTEMDNKIVSIDFYETK